MSVCGTRYYRNISVPGDNTVLVTDFGSILFVQFKLVFFSTASFNSEYSSVYDRSRIAFVLRGIELCVCRIVQWF